MVEGMRNYLTRHMGEKVRQRKLVGEEAQNRYVALTAMLRHRIKAVDSLLIDALYHEGSCEWSFFTIGTCEVYFSCIFSWSSPLICLPESILPASLPQSNIK